MKEIKTLITAVPVLRYYDINRPVTIQSDSSQTGLGCCLLQEGQPVAFASRALSQTEQNYAQIEKECLSIVFACQRFHYYLYGRGDVTAETDHRPLVSIFVKPLLSAPKRLQSMLLTLQNYCLKWCTSQARKCTSVTRSAELLPHHRAQTHSTGGKWSAACSRNSTTSQQFSRQTI